MCSICIFSYQCTYNVHRHRWKSKKLIFAFAKFIYFKLVWLISDETNAQFERVLKNLFLEKWIGNQQMCLGMYFSAKYTLPYLFRCINLLIEIASGKILGLSADTWSLIKHGGSFCKPKFTRRGVKDCTSVLRCTKPQKNTPTYPPRNAKTCSYF